MHNTTSNKAAPLTGTASTPRAQYKRFPAFGKRLMDQRMGGQVPLNCVAVVFEWNLGRIFSRVVITDDVPIENLELRFLAGLDVMIVYRGRDASRVHELAQSILAVNPRLLQAFHIGIPQTKIIKHSDGECLI
jgi:hypothetical protein